MPEAGAPDSGADVFVGHEQLPDQAGPGVLDH